MSYTGPAIVFDQVKELTISDLTNNFEHVKFIFNALNKIELAADGNINSEWVKLLGSSPRLKEIDISSGYLNDENLLNLAKT